MTARNSTATQASVFLDGFTFRRFLEDCYSENRRRMGVFDAELLRPSFLPQLAETALGAMRLWSFRAKSAAGLMKWAPKIGVAVALLAGLVAAVYLVWAIGFDAVLAAIARAGFGGLALLCLYALVVFISLAAGLVFPAAAGRTPSVAANSLSPGWCAIPSPKFRLSRPSAAWSPPPG